MKLHNKVHYYTKRMSCSRHAGGDEKSHDLHKIPLDHMGKKPLHYNEKYTGVWSTMELDTLSKPETTVHVYDKLLDGKLGIHPCTQLDASTCQNKTCKKTKDQIGTVLKKSQVINKITNLYGAYPCNMYTIT